ncbi:hypothetical protein F4802DRAFT_604407 [Xylaria palmicola]|nr:hypothetical protein F4802DRAFT_604407 [Xylaria palmicola]
MMSREHHRRRSPESSRRRRRERRDSREQLQSHPMPASIPTTIPTSIPTPYQEPFPPQQSDGRDRDYGFSSSYSSTTTSSSTSSSLLNISRPAKKFAIGAFFSGDGRKLHRRVRKKRSKLLRFGNSSSSSVGSDLAYGRGYIDRRRSREFSPPSGHRPPRRHGDPDRPSPPKRAQTDEEIIELGRKFAELARQQNNEDLRAAGRKRPSTLSGAVTALNQFRRTNSGNLNRGIGNSKPQRDSSDDSDWESASSDDESSEGSSDNGLVYGSSHYLPSSSGRPSHLSTTDQPAQAYPHDRPLNRKPSLVDPKLFGPINSLRGFVQTPCGFERVDRNTVGDPHSRYEPPIAPGETAPPTDGRPLQHVYPEPTSDPSRFDAGRGSVASAREDSAYRSRPEPVVIQQPKPIAPVHSRSSKRPSLAKIVAPNTGIGLPAGPVVSAAWSSDAAIDQETYPDDTTQGPQHAGDERYYRKYRRIADRDVLPDAPLEKLPEPEPEARVDEGEKPRRDKRVTDTDRERRSRGRGKHRDAEDRIAKVEQYRDDLGDDGKVNRSVVHGARNDNLASSEDPNITLSKGPIDPFQYQVADDAFPTPRHGTPTESLPPVIMTVEREPDFSNFESYDPYERLSRKDSFERERQLAQKTPEPDEQATIALKEAAFAAAAAAAAGIAARKLQRTPKHDISSQEHSQRSSSSPRAKDPVLDDADRAYREARLARRIKQQEERSRSNSPDRSVVDKWKDNKDSDNAHQDASSVVMDGPKQKSPYDGPNADVRIDNVLEHPKDLSQRESQSNLRKRLWSSKSPSETHNATFHDPELLNRLN